MVVAALFSIIALVSCGKSSEEMARENALREAAMQKTLADSVAEEREKDRKMRDAAAAQAGERIARETAAHELEVAAASAAASAAGPTPEQQQADRTDALRKYTDRLMQSMHESGSVQVRKMELSPKQNGMCAEISAKPAAGSNAVFKRVVVTDARVAVEEPPLRDTLNEFLLFQLAARDTGCFPDVEKLRILQ